MLRNVTLITQLSVLRSKGFVNVSLNCFYNADVIETIADFVAFRNVTFAYF